MAYAKRTKVPVSQSKAEIEALVKRYGADAFGVMEISDRLQVVFQMAGRHLMFRVDLPECAQERRSMFRALLLTIKGKLESAERGIETLEEAFLANIVMPDGRTVSETTASQIDAAYQGHDVPLLPRY